MFGTHITEKVSNQ